MAPELAIITPYFPPVLGGAENQMALIAEGLAAKGVGTIVYTSAVPIERRSSTENRIHIEQCAPARGNGADWTHDLLQRLQTVETPYTAALVLLSSVYPRTTVEAAQLLHKSGTRVVVRVSSAGRLAALEERDRSALSQIAVFVAHSEPLRQELISDGVPSDRVLTIPNSPRVSVGTVSADTRRRSLTRTVLFAGRLDPKKDVALLLAAWKTAASRLGEARLRIVGSDSWEVWKGRHESRADLLEAVQTLQLSRVQFVGEKSQVEMLAEYLAASVAVSASRNEGMSNFLIEAMACGLPLICSDIPANQFIDVHSGNWKFEVGNQHSLSLALHSALAMPQSVLQSIGRMNYDWSTRNLALGPILALYRSALLI
jgi:glycosyltransferase involved in cell wall biosynthesis